MHVSLDLLGNTNADKKQHKVQTWFR